MPNSPLESPILWFESVRREDVAKVGGKNASLGEMVRSLGDRGVRVPPGFATVAGAYWRFLEANGLNGVIEERLAEYKTGKASLAETGSAIRTAFLKADWPDDLAGAIGEAYRQLCARIGQTDADVAVRSSATAEDLPDASFAGQQETFLNIRGEGELLKACRRCFASLFTDRAISYREAKGFDHLKVALSAAAFRWRLPPADGVGLARMEFVISNHVKIHPMALAHFDALTDEDVKQQIADLTQGYERKEDYFVDQLARGLARIAAALHPRPVIMRMSDFKTNEYAGLIGGAAFEPKEANPMIGFRGASRYYSPRYRDGFALECQAIGRLRGEMGFANVVVMIPFCRSVKEADRVLDVMGQNGLKRGENGLEVYVMCEIPSNVVLAQAFAERFDGFSIGSNDLTQLTLGVDRDSEDLSELFDEQDPAVKWMIQNVITEAHKAGAKVGLCGQAPSDHPEFARFLVECGIDSISVTPDSFIPVKQHVAEAERQSGGKRSK